MVSENQIIPKKQVGHVLRDTLYHTFNYSFSLPKTVNNSFCHKTISVSSQAIRNNIFENSSLSIKYLYLWYAFVFGAVSCVLDRMFYSHRNHKIGEYPHAKI